MKQLFFIVALMLSSLAASFAQKVEVQGNLAVTGGLKLTWVDTSGTTYVLTPNVYGLTMSGAGNKVLVLPTITAAIRGQVYTVTNTSSSGNITLTTAQSVDGTDKIQPGRTARIEANTLTSWVVNLY